MMNNENMIHVYSNDTYFIAGIKNALAFSGINFMHDIAVIDPGGEDIYITRAAEFHRPGLADTLTHFIETRCYSLRKKAPVAEYLYVLNLMANNARIPFHVKPLTEREGLICESYLAGRERKEIAQKMHLSEQALSYSQVKALRKMNIKSIPFLLKVMKNWYAFGSESFVDYPRHTSCCMPVDNNLAHPWVSACRGL